MKYVGSKNRLSKHLKPIIESYITEDTEVYIEPFVGGANMIDKIDFDRKLGFDNNKYLIALLNHLLKGRKLVKGVDRETYNDVKNNKEKYSDYFVGLVGLCATYNAKWFGGYAGKCETKQGVRHYDREAIRNIKKQAKNPLFKNCKFMYSDFKDIDIDFVKESVVYCDIPYKNTTKYKNSDFDYEYFYNWCKKLKKNNNTVLISEYNMPDGFKCIWSKPLKNTLNKNNHKKSIEKLYIVE